MRLGSRAAARSLSTRSDARVAFQAKYNAPALSSKEASMIHCSKPSPSTVSQAAEAQCFTAFISDIMRLTFSATRTLALHPPAGLAHSGWALPSLAPPHPLWAILARLRRVLLVARGSGW